MDLSRGSKTVVVGASGLLGKALVDTLVAEGNNVIAFVRPERSSLGSASSNLKYVGLDLESDFDVRSVISQGVQQVVYLAQSPYHNTFPKGAGSVSALNVVAPLRLAEQALDCGISRFIFASSGGVAQTDGVDSLKGIKTISDEAPIRDDQMGFYLTTKAQTEKSLSYFKGLSICRIRYFFIYGPHQRSEMLIPRMITSVRDGKVVTLGSGRGPRLNPIYVEDAAKATSLILQSDIEDTINVAGSEIVSLKDICDIIATTMGRGPVFESNDIMPADFVARTSKLNGLGFISRFTLKSGFESMLSTSS